MYGLSNVLDVAGRVLPLSDIGPREPFKRRPRATQGASSGFYRGGASSCPGDLELPPAASGASSCPNDLELPPTDNVASRSDEPTASQGCVLKIGKQPKLWE